MNDHLPVPSPDALSHTVHEIIDFVDAEGWDRPPVMFALVPTALLAAAEPTLSDQLDDGREYTPIVQDVLPDDIEGGSLHWTSSRDHQLAGLGVRLCARAGNRRAPP